VGFEVGADRRVVLDDQWIPPALACAAAAKHDRRIARGDDRMSELITWRGGFEVHGIIGNIQREGAIPNRAGAVRLADGLQPDHLYLCARDRRPKPDEEEDTCAGRDYFQRKRFTLRRSHQSGDAVVYQENSGNNP